jgi:hydroxypyruvate isomerase
MNMNMNKEEKSMKCSLVADIMFVAPGEHGPVWPDEKGLCDAMDLAKSNGLSAIEIFDFEGRDLELLAAEAKKRDMEIISFCQKNGKFWGDPARLDEFVRGFCDSVEAAKKLGASNVIVSDDLYPADLPREQVHAAMVEGLKRVAPLAEQAGLTVIAEPLSGKYFRDAVEPFDIIREVNSPNVKLLYDIFHFQLIAGNITRTLRENIDLIGHIHGAGAPDRGDMTEGELDYSYILEQLSKTGYDKYFGLEFFTFENREEKVWKSAKLVRRNRELRQQLAEYFAAHRNS